MHACKPVVGDSQNQIMNISSSIIGAQLYLRTWIIVWESYGSIFWCFFCRLTPCGHPELSLSGFCHFRLGYSWYELWHSFHLIFKGACSFEFALAFFHPCDTCAERDVRIQTRQPSYIWVQYWGLEFEILKFLAFVCFCSVTGILCFHWLGFLVLSFCAARGLFLSSTACFRIVMFCVDAQSGRALIGSMFVSCFVWALFCLCHELLCQLS